MDNQRSKNPSEGRSSPAVHGASSPTPRGIRGHYSGNIGDYSTYGNVSTTNNYYNNGPTNTSGKLPEILQCLYTSRYESHRNRVREPVGGTCAWVTEHEKYKDWLGQKTSGVLWLSADPGCGKSVIASFLVNHLKMRKDATVCYFFFKDDNEEQRSATFALCAILHQLFVQRNPLCIYAEGAFEAKGKRFTEEMDTLWNILVEAVMEGGCGDVVCVVDALDECDKETLTPLLRRMTCLPESQQTSDTSLKFLVTVRPYHKIERELDSLGTLYTGHTTAEIRRITR
ncbi:hypothetical protein C7212DRAFT_348848 [Tuber magnatum]|uniref:Nephrocystin 3-like N-terminal domain-containing protein n=1 Tax=Tuber magnatum TaxID=42249 RepID=A0A317SAZ8_9PEZI|nr:hypothetical protein C7212DRAFT_348848 [Tuber magnatum]